ncbi:MAG: OmpA family protein, partial [Roseiarcus sp.]
VDAPAPEPSDADLTAQPPDAKGAIPPKKHVAKPKPASGAVETSPLDLGAAPSPATLAPPAAPAAPAAPAPRATPMRRFFPTDSAPIPPANIGQ